MSKPLDTTHSRRFGVIIAFWIVAVGSIVASNTQDIDGLTAYLIVIGEFYTWAHTALTDYATNATVPEWSVLVSYLVLAVIVLVVAVVILARYSFCEYNFELLGLFVFTLLVMMAGSVSGLIVFLSVVEPSVTAGLWFLLSTGPQVLVLSFMFLAISFVSAYVP